jgi:hypothetical protein
MPEEFCPERVIGKPYRDGMLPYGGGFSLKTENCLCYQLKRARADNSRAPCPCMSNSTGMIIRSKMEIHFMQAEEYDPAKIIGIPYRRGMLPYGGGVGPDGRVVFALSREDAERRVQKYRAISQ